MLRPNMSLGYCEFYVILLEFTKSVHVELLFSLKKLRSPTTKLRTTEFRNLYSNIDFVNLLSRTEL